MVDKIIIENLSIQYSDGTESLRNISLNIREKAVTVLFGPAGGGKSTLLRCLNRLNDLTEVKTSTGQIMIDGENILDPKTDVIALRRKVGMVFARPVPLPMSIRENITYGLELAGEKRRVKLDEAVERSLKLAAIWDEVNDRLDDPALPFLGGSNNVFVSRVCWRFNPRSFCLMNQPQASTPFLPARSKRRYRNSRRNTPSSLCLTPCSRQAAPLITPPSFYKVNLWNTMKAKNFSHPLNKNEPKITLPAGLDK